MSSLQINNLLLPDLAYGVSAFGPGAGVFSTNSTTHAYINQSTAKATVELGSGRLVRVDLLVSGYYVSNIAYSGAFDIGLDGTTTKSTSGQLTVSPAGVSGNIAANGSLRVEAQRTFFFTNIGSGSKTFYALWRSGNSAATVYIGEYASCQLVVTEIN